MDSSPGRQEHKKQLLSHLQKQSIWQSQTVAVRWSGFIPFWGELGYQLAPVPICGDNQGAIFIASNPITEKRSKHIDIHFHYIREVIKKKLIELYFIDGENNPADMLTKNLGRINFQKFRAMIGLEFLE